HLSTSLGGDRERLSKRHGATSMANFREMGVLPEALMNYMALLGWAPSGGDREIFSKEELIREFSLERVTPSPAVFDMEKLYWLNRHYIKERPIGEVVDLAIPSFAKAGLLPETSQATSVSKSDDVRAWFQKVVELLAPSVDYLVQLPERAAMIFNYDARAAIESPDNAEVLRFDKSSAVIEAFAKHARSEPQLTAERFKAIMNQVKKETGAKGKDLFHPVRIMLTGSHSGPEFDKLVPIVDEGSKLNLPRHVKSVRERVEEFTESRDRVIG